MNETSYTDLTILFAAWFCGSVVLVYFPVAFAGVVFHPLYERLKYRPPASVRYSITDLFILVVHLQVGALVVLLFVPRFPLAERATLWAMLATAQVAWWLAALSWLAQWKQIAARDHVWFLAVMAPIGFLCGAAIMPTHIFAFIAVMTVVMGAESAELINVAVVLAVVPWLGVLFTRDQCRRIVARCAAATELAKQAASTPVELGRNL